MAVLFESFVYPLIIMLSVPVAAAGGIAGLTVLNLYTYQALDMLTMLGFVILVGIVVNNAILLVHQSLHLIREENLPPNEAIALATKKPDSPDFLCRLSPASSVCCRWCCFLVPDRSFTAVSDQS